MGHFKCRKEANSQLLKLNFTVEDDLDEFFRRDNKKKKANAKKVKDSLQDSSVDSEYSDDHSDDAVDEKSPKARGKGKAKK